MLTTLLAGTFAPDLSSLLPGLYYEGDGRGANGSLELATGGTFRYTLTGCLGEYGRASGTWALSGGLLVLSPEGEKTRSLNLRFVPIKWGTRVLLVDEYGVPGFAHAAGEFSRDLDPLPEIEVLDFTKRDAKGGYGQRSGVPTLPDRYRVFYLRGAVLARVASLGSDGTAVLNQGRASGLRPGFRLSGSRGGPEVEILSVTERTSVARILYRWKTSVPPTAGEVLSTGGEYDRPSGTGATLFASPEAAPIPL